MVTDGLQVKRMRWKRVCHSAAFNYSNLARLVTPKDLLHLNVLNQFNQFLTSPMYWTIHATKQYIAYSMNATSEQTIASLC